MSSQIEEKRGQSVMPKNMLDTFIRPMYYIGMQKVTNTQRLLQFMKNHGGYVHMKDIRKHRFSPATLKTLWKNGMKNGDRQENLTVLKERPSVKKYPYPSRLRKELIDEGVLQQEKDRLLFVKNYEFTSPSAAASVIHGGHTNGLVVWKDAKGLLLKDKEQKNIK